MAGTGAPERLGAVHEKRVRALLTSFRQLRHDLASPLSGASLHLEMASRRLGQRADPELAKLSENVRVSQQEIAYAAGILDLVGEMARSADDELVSLTLASVLRRGAARSAARAAREGVSVEVPPEGGADFPIVGARDRLEQAFADLTTHAVARTGRGGVVTWNLDVKPSSAEASVAWPAGEGERAERAFVLSRRKPGDPPDAAFFLARWAVESVGGTLRVEQEGERLRARVAFPGGEESE